MTSNPPPPPNDAPHYNGRTLSPASPKPIHIPDVENIPVLHNQIDPIFNLVSTHMDPPKAQHGQTDHPTLQEPTSNQSLEPSSTENGAALNGADHAYLQEDQTAGTDESSNANIVTKNDPVYDPATSTSDTAESRPAQIQMNASNFASNQKIAADAPLELHGSVQNPAQPDGIASAVEVAPAEAASHDPAKSPVQALNVETGNIQALLDNLIASASSAPINEPEPATSNQADPAQTQSPAEVQTPISALPTNGLPARPPPQDESSINPSYAPGQDIQSYHKSPAPNAPPNAAQPSPLQAPANAVGSNGLQPPPAASFQQTEDSVMVDGEVQDDPSGPSGSTIEAVAPGPEVDHEQAYQDFLRAEANYVAEGSWDRFPQGSRLFVGNLFTEKVSKRMIWDMFSKYGTLAQISMKNAYGFAQFVDPTACTQAMMSEEGSELGGRKIHLEISKPQKNTRNQNDRNRGQGRRSRSPDYNRGSNVQRPGSNAYGGYGRRDRDDYRPMRSPSPRGGRNFDRYRRRSRSRSPYGRGHNRSRSPRQREMDDEASLPIPRRNPVQVPEVQIIVVDESDRTFVAYIQQAFRDRGLRCDVQPLPRGVSLQTVIKRQIIEGVRAVVKIYRKSQVTGKIPLQVFDRSLGMGDVRFDEYEELDATVAADVVIRAKSTQPNPQPNSQPQTPQFPPSFNNQPPALHPPFPPQGIPPPNSANAPNLAGLDNATIQKLLSTLSSQQQQQQQHSPNSGSFPPSTPDLATLLSSVARQTPQQQGQHQGGGSGPYGPPGPVPPHQQQQQGYPQQQPQQGGGYGINPNPAASLANNPALAQLLGRAQQQPQQPGYGGQAHQQGRGQGGQNVQDIMAQLSKFGGGGR